MDISANIGTSYQEQGSFVQSAPVKTVSDTNVASAPEVAAPEPLVVEKVENTAPLRGANKMNGQEDALAGKAGKDLENVDSVEESNEASKGRDQVREAIKEMNRKSHGTEAIFGIHEKTNRVTIKIVDKESKEVIKEVPPEKTLDLIAKAWELAGILVDEKR